jgi:Na+/melibiose symporter-like transporter
MSQETDMPANARPASRRMQRKTRYLIATCLSMLAYAILFLLSNQQGWLVWPALAAALLGCVFACFWVASLDEAAQQAHYIAWFWGGNAGLLLSMLAFVAAMLRPDAFAPLVQAMGASRIFAIGIVVGVMPAVIGYALWWAVLWLRRG